MDLKRTPMLLLGWFLVILFLVACNMPGRRTPTPSGFELINTAAAKTVMAQLTEISRPPVTPAGPTLAPQQTPPTLAATSSVVQTPSASFAPTQPISLTQVPQPTQAPPAGACDQARFIKDVTIPDNTVLQPGQSFTKTWRLRNVGDCTWDENYALVFVGGDQLGASNRVPLSRVVGQNETVEVSVEMVAPTTGGTFRSNWKLSNTAGQVFGTGQKSDQPIWAQIKVNDTQEDESSTGTQYDFVSSASSGAWFSGIGDNSGIPLAFGGTLENPRGAALIADQLRLETGQTSGKILVTVPSWNTDGYIYGIFPQYRVQAVDHFVARVGFAANPNGRCGAGRAIFQVAVRIGEDIDTLAETKAACDGSLSLIDVDLSNLRGQVVEFILAVRADGSPEDDWAVWNSPIIVKK